MQSFVEQPGVLELGFGSPLQRRAIALDAASIATAATSLTGLAATAEVQDGVWQITFQGDPGDTLFLVVDGDEANRIGMARVVESAQQQITLEAGFGLATLTYLGETTAPVDLSGTPEEAADAIARALQDLSNVEDVVVSVPDADPSLANGQRFNVRFVNAVQQSGEFGRLAFAPVDGVTDAIVLPTETLTQVFRVPVSGDSLTLEYAGTQVEIASDATAATVQARLQSLAAVTTARVTIEDDGALWRIELVETTAAAALQFAVDGGPLVAAPNEIENNADRHVQRLVLPAAGAVLLRYGDDRLAVFAGTSAADLEAGLESLEGIAHADVQGSGSTSDPYVVRLIEATTVNGTFLTLQASVARADLDAFAGFESVKTIERLAGGAYAPELENGLYRVADFELETDSEFYSLAAFQVVEREVPRQLRKPVYERNSAGELVQERDANGNPVFDYFVDPTIVRDSRVDTIRIEGSALNERFVIGHETRETGELTGGGAPIFDFDFESVKVAHTRGGVSNDSVVIYLRGLDLDDAEASVEHDELTVIGGDGDDEIWAGFIPNDPDTVTDEDILIARVVDDLTLVGGEGNDWLVGSRFADTLVSGIGDDTVTGNAGVDALIDDGGFDTLVEARDGNFLLTDLELEIVENNVTETEDVDPFEAFELFGGAGDNRFGVTEFTQELTLDGTEGGDAYFLNLSGTIAGQSVVVVRDSGTVSTDTDFIFIGGSTGDDTLHLDVDQSWAWQQLTHLEPASAFRLSYNGEQTAEITNADTSDSVRQKLEDLDGIDMVEVTGLGTDNEPWEIHILSATTTADGDFYRLLAGDADVARSRAGRALVERVHSSLAENLLASRPDVDALVERPINETQFFYRRSDGTVTFRYGSASTALAVSAQTDAADIEAALENLVADVDVSGSGTLGDPWRARFIDAPTDERNNFLSLEVSDDDILSAPVDSADSAAETRPSTALSRPDEYQRVYYDFSAELVEIHAGDGHDTIVSDDSMAAMRVYGDRGNDTFIIGRVIDTVTVEIDGQKIEVVNGDDGITAGVSFNAMFFGGGGDDYFEVNHNVGVLDLFGESGDDTFFLKAHRQLRGAATEEIDGGDITVGAGDDRNHIDQADQDVLIDFVENNRVNIYGGSGFDTVVIAGTALADTFHVYTGADGQQFLFGAGLAIDNIAGVERLALVTGGGDDEVFLYGLDASLSLVLNLGSGDDVIHVGGAEQTFTVNFPASSATYTVQQNNIEDVLQATALAHDDVFLVKRQMTREERVKAFQDFYRRWYVGASSTPVISDQHWALLEGNLAVALELFLLGVQGHWPSNYYSNRQPYVGNATSFYNEYLNLPGNNGFRPSDAGQIYARLDPANTMAQAQVPVMPDRIALPDLLRLNTENPVWLRGNLSNFGQPSIDDYLFDNFLRPAVAYSIWGDYLHDEAYTRPAYEWFFFPFNWLIPALPANLGNTQMRTDQVPHNGGNLAHVQGVKDNDVWMSRENRPNNRAGWDLLMDMIGLFYDVEAINTSHISVTETYVGQAVEGLASYRFADLPARTETRTLAANYDLSRVAGVIRIAGSAGDDRMIVNARDANGATVTVESRTLALAEFEFEGDPRAGIDMDSLSDDERQELEDDYLDWLASTYATVNGTDVRHEEVQDALFRANKETDIGVLDRLADGSLASTELELSLDREIDRFSLGDRVAALDTSLDTIEADNAPDAARRVATPEQLDWFNDVRAFTNAGLELTGADVASSYAFSLDSLNELLSRAALDELQAAGGKRDQAADALEARLEALRDYLVLAEINDFLDGNQYTRLESSGLRIYAQDSPNLSNRTAQYQYSQELWRDGDIAQAEQFRNSTGTYFAGRLDVDEGGEELDRTDESTRKLEDVLYNVGGTGLVSTVFRSGNPNLAGNDLELLKEYAAQLGALNESFFTYSYYGPDAAGIRTLSAVAIARVNGDVPQADLLDGGVYLTAANFAPWLQALEANGWLTATERNNVEALGFNDVSIGLLVATAFNQTPRTDVVAPVNDGLRIRQLTGPERYIDIEVVVDDSGTFIPLEITIRQDVRETITVAADYVVGRVDGSDYEVSYDTLLGLNEHGLFFSSFEEVAVDLGFGLDVADSFRFETSLGIDTLTVATHGGDDTIDIRVPSGTSTSFRLTGGDGDDTYDLQLAATPTSDDVDIWIDEIASPAGDADDRVIIRGGAASEFFHADSRIETSFRDGVSSQWGVVEQFIDANTDEYSTTDLGALFEGNTDAATADSLVNSDVRARLAAAPGAGLRTIHYREQTLDRIDLFAGDGDDVLVLDDTLAWAGIFAGAGDDSVFVGTVLGNATTTTADGREIVYVTEITNGVSYSADVFGDSGNDYLEVNHNRADISLSGGYGDDTFFMRSHLGLDGNQLATYQGIALSTGEDEDEILNTIGNGHVSVDGGSGFDSFALAGTAADDAIRIATKLDNGVQVLTITGISNSNGYDSRDVERTVILGGPGNDQFFVDGLIAEHDLHLVGGSDDDTFIFANGLENVQGRLFIRGTAGNDRIVIDHASQVQDGAVTAESVSAGVAIVDETFVPARLLATLPLTRSGLARALRDELNRRPRLAQEMAAAADGAATREFLVRVGTYFGRVDASDPAALDASFAAKGFTRAGNDIVDGSDTFRVYEHPDFDDTGRAVRFVVSANGDTYLDSVDGITASAGDTGAGIGVEVANDFVVEVQRAHTGIENSIIGFGMAESISFRDVQQVEMTLGTASDRIRIDALGAEVDFHLAQGSGDDIVDIGLRGDGTSMLENVRGRVHIAGGAGDDTVNILNRTDGADRASRLDGRTFTSTAMDGDDAFVNLGNASGVVTVEELNVELGAGTDRVTLRDTIAGTSIYGHSGDDSLYVQAIQHTVLVDGGAGADFFYVADDASGPPGAASFGLPDVTTGVADLIAGTLLLDGGAGANRLLVSDFADGTGDVARMDGVGDDVRLTGMAAGEIRYRATGGDFTGGVEVLFGSGGDTLTVADLFDGNSSPTWLYLGAGADRALVTAGVHAGLSSALHIWGQRGQDDVDGSLASLSLTIRGNEDEDTLRGGSGSDAIYGDEADDVLFGNGSGDAIDGGAGNDIAFGDFGTVTRQPNGQLRLETLRGHPGYDDAISGGAGNDLLLGGAGSDRVSGDDGNDLLLGDLGYVQVGGGRRTAEATDPLEGDIDVLEGGAGFDIMIGGRGADLFLGDFVTDIMLGGFGRVVDDPVTGKGLRVSTDPTDRDPIALSLYELFNAESPAGFDASSPPGEPGDEDEEPAGEQAIPGALQLQRLLTPEDLEGLTDQQLKDFLRALPLPGDGPTGGSGASEPPRNRPRLKIRTKPTRMPIRWRPWSGPACSPPSASGAASSRRTCRRTRPRAPR